jgi:2,3-bisphosphoglycerate-independent phosphoglycerate mutase
MKYVVLIGDGMTDRPLKLLGYKTCLQTAHTPNMDRLAAQGEVGTARTVPHGFEPGSDVANLSILGYNPSKYYSGRAPLEAIYRGIDLGPKDVAFRCNLVTLNFRNNQDMDGAVMQDYSAGHITTRESGRIIREINKRIGGSEILFHPGISYRHLMIWKNGNYKLKCTPPHDISGKKIGRFLPRGKGADVLTSLMQNSNDVLINHPVNKNRSKRNLNIANNLWFWGHGRKSLMPKFEDMHKLKGALISAVDLAKGLGMSAGFDVLNVKGATGYIDTNYDGKAKAALGALNKYDIVYVHVEAPDEAGHNGNMNDKLKAIEDFDAKVVGTVMKGIKKFKNYRILLMPDHFTPLKLKTHTDDPVPFAIFRSDAMPCSNKPRAKGFSENICRMKNVTNFDKGYRLMGYFLKGKK